MELGRRSTLVYILLAVLWLLVVGWQVQEHSRVQETARTDLRKRSEDIASTLGAFIRGLRFRGTVVQDRLEPVLQELVSAETDAPARTSELLSIALLNADGEPVAAAGAPLDFAQLKSLQKAEQWTARTVTLINPVDLGALVTQEGITNPTIVLPPFTNVMREGMRPPRGDSDTNAVREGPRPPPEFQARTNTDPGQEPPPPPPREGRGRDGEGRSRRPFWMRGFDDEEFQRMLAKRALHGLVLVMSTEQMQAGVQRDLWLRALLILLTTISVAGSGLAWRNLVRSSELQLRLVRASEMNTQLKEMNLAAAGLAHETRNPLNIVRGLAQMISKRPDTGPEIREKAGEIIGEADKVAAQLNEFINYSRPREIRPVPVNLHAVAAEVSRALTYDVEEKNVKLIVQGDALQVQADEQLLRQALFNLLLNAVQAVESNGEITVAFSRSAAREAQLEVRDNGPGVPPEHRPDIFKPYFTTNQKGTGLGLAVVQQIVLAHGWEVACLSNSPKGAIFRISHMTTAA